MGVVNNLIDILKLKDRVTKLEKGGGGGYELPTAGMNTKGGVKVNPMYGFTMDGEYLSMRIGGKQGTIGGVVPEVKQSGDTQPVRVDTNTGKLWTAPGGGSGGQSISKYRMSMRADVTYPYTFKKYGSTVQTVDFDVLVIDKDGTKIGVPIAHEPIEIVLEKESMGTLSAADTLYQNSKTFDFLFISGEEVSSMLGSMYTAGEINGEMNNIIGDMDVNLLFKMTNKVTMNFVSHPNYSVAENLRLDKKIIIH